MSDLFNLHEVNCWEYTGCGFDEGGINAARHGTCAAYPDHGRTCPAIRQTKCHLGGSGVAGGLPMPDVRDCRQCGFYLDVLAAASRNPRAAI